MTACEILLYLNTYYYPCEEPSVPVVTPPDYADIEDDWQDAGGNDTLPEEDFEIELNGSNLVVSYRPSGQ